MSKSLLVHEKDSLKSIQLYDELGFYPTKSYKNYCASRTYLMLAGSWWKDGNNKLRGLKYIFKSLFTDPKPLLEKIFQILMKNQNVLVLTPLVLQRSISSDLYIAFY
ncbi:MAG: hypothetical protein KatS3mg035_1498 [Bacteroidia bacterium]|nr:MAG: hypothetical protein KatS3mg035_1498 [Bacteroidia bacterium]